MTIIQCLQLTNGKRYLLIKPKEKRRETTGIFETQTSINSMEQSKQIDLIDKCQPINTNKCFSGY